MRNRYSESKSLRLLWGGIAFSIYFTLLGLLLFYFNHRNSKKPKHFVKKNERRIQIATSSPVKTIKIKTIIKNLPFKPKKVVKSKVIPKKSMIKEKIIPKSIVKKDKKIKKPKIKKVAKVKHKIKKPKIKKLEKSKVKKTSDLFSSVKITKKSSEIKKTSMKKKVKSASEKITESIKNQKQSDRGIENVYFAKVQSLLETWPAQSDYAGEKAMVHIYVKPTGMFEFKVKSQSENVEFNLGLIDFLMQLQHIGLGKHNAGKTYEFEVEFIAKD